MVTAVTRLQGVWLELINFIFGMVTGYRLQLGLRGIIYFAPRVTGYKVKRGVAGITRLKGGMEEGGESGTAKGPGAREQGLGTRLQQFLPIEIIN